MVIYVPEAWTERAQILKTLGGSERVEAVFGAVSSKEIAKENTNTETKEVKVDEKTTEVKSEAKPTVVEKESVKAKLEAQEVKVDEKTTEVKDEPETAVVEEVKPVEKTTEVKVESKPTVVEEVKASEPDAKLKADSEEDKITMSNSKTCPIRIRPTETESVHIDVTGKHEEAVDESLESLKTHLNDIGVKYANIKRLPNGLVDVGIIQVTGQVVPITIDIDDRLYGLGAYVFFIGKINPLDEYTKRAVLLNKESIAYVINGVPIDSKYYVPELTVKLAMTIDTESLHEHNIDKKQVVLNKALSATASVQEEIQKSLGNEPYRFAFTKYKSENDFTLVSSNRNRVSNLSDDKLRTSKEIRIVVKDKNVTMNIK